MHLWQQNILFILYNVLYLIVLEGMTILSMIVFYVNRLDELFC